MMKVDWGGQDLDPEALVERVRALRRTWRGADRRGRQRVQLYLPDNPRLFAPLRRVGAEEGAGGEGEERQEGTPHARDDAGGDEGDEARATRLLRVLLRMSDDEDSDDDQAEAADENLKAKRRDEGGRGGDVEVLHLGNTRMGRLAARALAQLLRSGSSADADRPIAPHLTKLWLKRNALTMEGALEVLHAATVVSGEGDDGTDRCGAPALTSLDFFNAQLGPDAASAFADVLQTNKKIKHMYLGGNHFGPTGASAMARMLTETSVLTRLSLDISHLTDEGAFRLAEALRRNTRLTYLCLKYNGFTPQGVAALFAALLDNPRSRLQTLILGWKLTYEELAHKDEVPVDEIASLANHVGCLAPSVRCDQDEASNDDPEAEPTASLSAPASLSEGVQGIISVLRASHCSLTHLNLCRTFITTEELRAIAEASHHNSSLRQLHLFPQSDDPAVKQEQKIIADQVRRILMDRKKHPKDEEEEETSSTRPHPSVQPPEVEKKQESAEPMQVEPTKNIGELRKRRREIQEELQTLDGSDEKGAARREQLEAELTQIAEITRQAKGVAESARKVMRKLRKKQRKELQRAQDQP